MKKSVKLAFSVAILLSLTNSLQAFEPKKPTCLAPAKPGGGFDLTCKIAANSFAATHLLNKPMIVNFMPGGVGAVAYNHVIGQKPNDGNVIVAFSSGSALNIAQGKFGKYNENAVRWLDGKFKELPTAKEQGYDVVWSTWREYYMGPKVSDTQYDFWVEKFKKLSQTDEFKKERDLRGLQSFTMVGSEFDHFVKSEVAKFKSMAREAGLVK
ncbi:hypothetical protein A0W86_00400 [Campylobacter fetus]|nr:hypothetical protein [Campylobacter fetus]